MGYQPRTKPRNRTGEFKKTYQRKEKTQSLKKLGNSQVQEKQIATEQEITQITLKRLHTLGTQKFGSSPFNQHFSRWLSNVEDVLAQFQANPNIGVDDEFLAECAQALEVIRLQLEDRGKKETAIDQEIQNLAYLRKQLKQIDREYVVFARTIKSRKNSEIRRLNRQIDELKKQQEIIIRTKAGLFHRISKRAREQKEFEITQQLSDAQTQHEVVTLELRAELKQAKEDYERKREPVLEQIKVFQKKIRTIETDGSLEERWFACEALMDAVNNFLQRKRLKSN